MTVTLADELESDVREYCAAGKREAHPRAGDLANLVSMVESIKARARVIRAQQKDHPGYAAKALRGMMDTMHSAVKSELRKLQREMEFPQ